MKPAALSSARRMFFVVLVVVALGSLWFLSEPWRTGIQHHTAAESGYSYGYLWRNGGLRAVSAKLFGVFAGINLGTNQMEWSRAGDGNGYFYATEPRSSSSRSSWEFAPCELKELAEVTAADVQRDFFGHGPAGQSVFGNDWRTNAVMIHDGRIILVRSRQDTQTVHAILPVKQGGGAASFRSRKILLPAPESR